MSESEYGTLIPSKLMVNTCEVYSNWSEPEGVPSSCVIQQFSIVSEIYMVIRLSPLQKACDKVFLNDLGYSYMVVRLSLLSKCCYVDSRISDKL